MYLTRVAGLAQLVEHLICNQRVGSSSLSTGTIPSQHIAQSTIDFVM